MKKTTPLLKVIYPGKKCPLTELRPTFKWKWASNRKPPLKGIYFALKVVSLYEKEHIETALSKKKAVVHIDNIPASRVKFPHGTESLASDTVYAYQVKAYDAQRKPIGESDIGLFVTESKDLPFSLRNLMCCNKSRLHKNFTAWQKAYGSPLIKPETSGCFGRKGVIALSGGQHSGDAVFQTFSSRHKIIAGHRYALKLCLRLVPKQLPYVRFRVLAFNGALPDSGLHPEPSADIALIGETSRITSDQWVIYAMPAWLAHRDFDSIAILAISDDEDDKIITFGEISNICWQLVDADDCGLFVNAVNSETNMAMPDAWKKLLDSNEQQAPQDLEFDRGKLQDIYGSAFDLAGNSNWYKPGDPCMSVGGEIPPEVTDRLGEARTPDLGQGITSKDIDKAMQIILQQIGHTADLSNLKPVADDKQKHCAAFVSDKGLPFGGRDIIYVHGFQPRHVIGLISRRDSSGILQPFLDGPTPDAGLEQHWPEDGDAFFADGFFKKQAENYWGDHIAEHLGDEDQPSNRYLVVAYNSNQRLIENVHAMLHQISLAMNEGVGVVHNDKDPRGSTCFGRESVIISHSTGALVTDVAMSLANRSATSTEVAKILGNAQYLSTSSRVHISLHGAIAGSELAELAVVGANILSQLAPAIDAAVDTGISVSNSGQLGLDLLKRGLSEFGISSLEIENFLDNASDSLVTLAAAAVPVVNGSILVDLSPLIAKVLWGQSINSTPVPVLTVAGGHPSDGVPFKPALRGFDDGVVNTNSQSASPSLLHPDSFQYLKPMDRLFDMGIPLARASAYFIDQYLGDVFTAYGSIPFLSPSGMVQPVAVSPYPLPRYQNHYTFLQSASEHQHPISNPGGSYAASFGFANYEESLVVESPIVYDNGLVNPDIKDLMIESVRGQDMLIKIAIPYPVISGFPPLLTIQYLEQEYYIPLWRRSYHLLGTPIGGNPVEDSYVYRYVLR